jgi:predicted O-methyltransferase YrrM
MSKKTLSPTFSQDWFSRSIPGWQFILSRMAEKTPNLRILEVGVFEGRSTCWLLENFCKTPESTIVAIDSFQGGIEHKNLELVGLKKQFDQRGQELIIDILAFELRTKSHIDKNGIRRRSAVS